MVCGGSVALSAASPDYHDALEDFAAEEGTAAHWVFEQMHRGHKVSAGDMSPNRVIVTGEMIECAEELCSIVPQHAPVEQHVDLTHVGLSQGGTRDAGWHADGVAHVLDYKFGHKYVEEFENWQLLLYAADINFDYLGIHTLALHIFQPRCYFAEPHRVWTLTVEEYRTKYLPRFQAQVAKINAGIAPLVAEPSVCHLCPAAASCRALADAAYSAMDMTYQNSSPSLMSDTALSKELDALKRAGELLEARQVALEEQANHIIRGGGRVPGWERVQSQGRLAWTVPVETVEQFGAAFGVKTVEPKPITPTQALKAGLPQAVVDSAAARPPGKMKLTKINQQFARKVFNNV